MASASPLPSGMSEAAPSFASNIISGAFLPGASIEVLEGKEIEDQPCCLQFSPTSRDLLVVGTYNLDDPLTQVRSGKLLLYRLRDEKLLLLDTFVYSAGILDLKFNDCKDVEKFAVASSTGKVSFFKLENIPLTVLNHRPVRIVHLNSFQILPESIVLMSLAWHNSPNGQLAVSQSNGQVSIVDFREDYTQLHNVLAVNRHGQNAAWTVVFATDETTLYDEDNPNDLSGAHFLPPSPGNIHSLPFPSEQGVYSGGDDSRLRFSRFFRDNRGKTHLLQSSSNGPGDDQGLGGFGSGVTAILPFPFWSRPGEEILITGSFDDHVRVYTMCDRRPGALDMTPKILAELNVGGGVFRLAFVDEKTGSHPAEGSTCRVLATCMQGGVRVLDITGSTDNTAPWTIKVIAEMRFNTGNELVYGGDMQPPVAAPATHRRGGKKVLSLVDEGDGEEYVFVSANFYAKQLCVWKYIKPGTPLSPKTSYLRDRAAKFGCHEGNEERAGAGTD